MSERPRRLVVVFGTATDIGKTWVGCRMLEAARATGRRVAARKPVQSFDPPPAMVGVHELPGVVAENRREVGQSPAATVAADELPGVVAENRPEVGQSSAAAATEGAAPGAGGGTDAEWLAAATGESPTQVCPAHRWYPVAVAPPMAATWLGRPDITVAELAAEIIWPAGIDIGLVETAGGPRSPIAHDGDGIALAEILRPDLAVLVADAALGTINAVRLAADAIGPLPLVIVLNRFDGGDPLHVANHAWLRDVDHLDVVTDPTAVLDRL